MGTTIILAGLLAAGAPPAPAPTAVDAQACRVMEAAYTATLYSATLVHPGAVIAPWHRPSPLRDYVPEYRRKLPLSPAEFAELQAEQGKYDSVAFIPSCAWHGTRRDRADQEVVYDTSFSNPIFSPRHDRAIVDVSFYHGRFGFGYTCVARKVETTWTSRCFSGWIT